MKKLLYFTAGLAIGSIATWKFVKDKYEKLANEEIETARKALSAKKETKNEPESPKLEKTSIEEKSNFTNEEVNKYHSLTKKYTKDDHGTDEEESKNVIDDEPYMIDDSDFGLFEDYDTITLNYYLDGVVADELDVKVNNPEETVGDVESYFNKTNSDMIYVRNDIRKCDYEILKCNDKFSELYQ